MVQFSTRLRQLRERRGMSRAVLAECCGLSKNSIARYERGERVPDIRSLMVLADFFEVTMDDLCGRKKFF